METRSSQHLQSPTPPTKKKGWVPCVCETQEDRRLTNCLAALPSPSVVFVCDSVRRSVTIVSSLAPTDAAWSVTPAYHGASEARAFGAHEQRGTAEHSVLLILENPNRTVVESCREGSAKNAPSMLQAPRVAEQKRSSQAKGLAHHHQQGDDDGAGSSTAGYPFKSKGFCLRRKSLSLTARLGAAHG